MRLAMYLHVLKISMVGINRGYSTSLVIRAMCMGKYYLKETFNCA